AFSLGDGARRSAAAADASLARRGKSGTGDESRFETSVGKPSLSVALAPAWKGTPLRLLVAFEPSTSKVTRSKAVNARIRRAPASSNASPLAFARPAIQPPTEPRNAPKPSSELGTASKRTRPSTT